MTHDEFQAALDAYVDRSLSPARSAEMTAHLRACTACATKWEAAFQLRAALQEADELELLPPVAPLEHPRSDPSTEPRRRGVLLYLRPLLAGAVGAAPLAAAAGILLALQFGWVTTPGGGLPGMQPEGEHESVALRGGGKTRGGGGDTPSPDYTARIVIPAPVAGRPALDPLRVVSIDGLREYLAAHPDQQLTLRQGTLSPEFRARLAEAQVPVVDRSLGGAGAVELVLEAKAR